MIRITYMIKQSNIINLILVLISISTYGQGSNKEIRLSINAGMTFSNTIGKGIDEDSWINGYPPDCYTNSSASDDFILGKKFGIGLIKDLNKTFSIGLELNYEEKGCKIPITHLSYLISSNGTYELVEQKVDEKSNIRLKYLVLPFKLETRFKMIYFQSGIYGGILLDADDFGEIDGIDFERDKDSRYSLLDFGLLVGLGTRIPLSDKNIVKIGVNGNWNITGNESRAMEPGYTYHWYNQTFYFEIKFEREI